MATSLPLDVLRSFVAIVDCGSMLKAADRVFLTQSALSLQMKRLEELLQTAVFSRDGRRLTLTPAGEVFLGYARRLLALNDEALRVVACEPAAPVRIGMVQDYAESLLGGVLADFAAAHPRGRLHARVGGTLELLETLERGALDLVLGYDEGGALEALRRDPMRWIGRPGLAAREALPLAVLEKPCRFREAAIAALRDAGRAFEIALETPNLSTLRAGVEAGFGLTCRTDVFAAGLPAPKDADLPPLPRVVTRLWMGAEASPAAGALGGLLEDVVRGLA